ncbi:MAG TPA: hypothetical protein VII73_11405 [Caulobacteraceae bacterium]
MLVLVGLAFAPGLPALADDAVAPTAGLACGVTLSPPILEKWLTLGGEKGFLGCPAARESPTLPSPTGAVGRQATFGAGDGGAILWHANGPRAGQTYAVLGCVWRLYFQYGGPSGWLGLPISEAVNTPDGKIQSFEGGSITYTRAFGQCSASHDVEEVAEKPSTSAAPADAPKAPLDLFFDPARGDYLTTASAGAAAQALAAHYQRVRTEAFVFTTRQPGTTPLKLYWNEKLGDNDTVATEEGERDALAKDYEYGGLQGYVYSDPRPGAKALKLFYNAERHDNFLTATAEGAADAAAQGYVFVRIEGYAPAAP